MFHLCHNQFGSSFLFVYLLVLFRENISMCVCSWCIGTCAWVCVFVCVCMGTSGCMMYGTCIRMYKCAWFMYACMGVEGMMSRGIHVEVRGQLCGGRVLQVCSWDRAQVTKCVHEAPFFSCWAISPLYNFFLNLIYIVYLYKYLNNSSSIRWWSRVKVFVVLTIKEGVGACWQSRIGKRTK